MARNKDYLLKFVDGSPVAAEDSGNAIANRIYTATMLKKGTLMSDYEWGSELHKVKKDVPAASLIAKRYVENSIAKIAELSDSTVNIETKDSQLTIDIKAKLNGQLLTSKINI